MIKFVDIISQGPLGTLLGMSGPKYYYGQFLIRWHISQPVMYFLTNVVILDHQ